MGAEDNYVQEPLICREVRTDDAKKQRRETGTNDFRGKELEFIQSDTANCIQTALTKDNLIMVAEATKKGYDIASEGDSINLSNPNSETRRGRVGKQIANTLETSCNQAVVLGVENPSLNKDGTVTAIDANYFKGHGTRGNKHRALGITNNRIRRLTPLECFRLQGFPDEFVKTVSDTQLYKQAGNTITVNVIKAILKNLLQHEINK